MMVNTRGGIAPTATAAAPSPANWPQHPPPNYSSQSHPLPYSQYPGPQPQYPGLPPPHYQNSQTSQQHTGTGGEANPPPYIYTQAGTPQYGPGYPQALGQQQHPTPHESARASSAGTNPTTADIIKAQAPQVNEQEDKNDEPESKVKPGTLGEDEEEADV